VRNEILTFFCEVLLSAGMMKWVSKNFGLKIFSKLLKFESSML
jgi:hypothetical protein